ncbi:MAG TPA: TRAP transporter substrate-binding protein DctP [Hyphomicrobiales bacterium]|nr:TRAP transporter substrate-binding protein DctP [Hyphomicrobiales bacterium]
MAPQRVAAATGRRRLLGDNEQGDKEMTTRRTFVAGALASAFAGTAGRAMAQATTRIRISTAAPPSDFLTKALDQLRTDVAAAGKGLDVSVHPASTLFRQGTEVQALQRGNLEMSTMTTFEVAQQMPKYGLFDRAYLFRDDDHLRRVFDGPIGEEYRRAVADQMGIEILATHYLGTRHVNLCKKRDVKGPADLAGVKLRMPAGPEWLLLGSTLGVTPVPLGMPEVYLAMKTGTVDGQENPLSILNAAKFYEVSQQVVLTTHMVQPVFFAMAKPAWDKLGADQKQVLQDAARKTARSGSEARLADETSIVASLKKRGLAVDAIDLAPFRQSADRVYAASSLAKAWDAALLSRVMAA